MRTVMRDDSKYPLEPPGVQRYRQLQLIAASVERVMVAPSSALMKKLSRMLAVLNLFQKEFEQLVMVFSWIDHINDLELLIGRIKKSRRHITGRKNTQDCILREGSFVAMLFGLPYPNHWLDTFAGVNPHDVYHSLKLLRQTKTQRKCWQARRDLGAYLAVLEQQVLPRE